MRERNTNTFAAMKMLVVGVLVALFGILVPSSPGQNQIVNGDFQTGALTPWIVTEGAVAISPEESGFAASTLNGTLAQTFVTKPGASYYVSFEATGGGRLGTFDVRAYPQTGGGPDGGVGLSNFSTAKDVTRHSFVFEATSDSTVLSIGINASDTGVPPGVVDDVLVVELTSSRLTGTYKGTLTRTLGVPELDVSQKVNEKIVANVDATGKIVIIRDAEDVSAGHILPDGSFAIRFSGVRRTGTVAIKGKRIEFEFNDAGFVRDASYGVVATEVSTRFVLSRIKR